MIRDVAPDAAADCLLDLQKKIKKKHFHVLFNFALNVEL